jgi:SAM-dependent MidA family methyltransferase
MDGDLLQAILKELINQSPGRRIDYEQYMKTVLYDPQNGYYRKSSVKVGKAGDFYTGPSVHPVFGKAIARFFIDLTEKENLPPVICEVGAGDGRFAQAVLCEWQRASPASYRDLKYLAVEESLFHKDLQRKYVSERNHFFQYDTLEQLQKEYPSFVGIIFSNELLDSFPIRVVQDVNGILYEAQITVNESGELTEVLDLCKDQEIFDWIDAYGFSLQKSQRIEIPLMMTEWLKKVADWLEHGAILTMDYGYKEKEWLRPERKKGSLRGYFRHRIISNPLLYPGQMDLTAHVHLDAVRKITETAGLTHVFTMPQRRFLLLAGILDDLSEHAETDPFSSSVRQNRAISSLISETSLGNAFYAMLQTKRLSGRFLKDWVSRNPVQKAIQKRR